MNFYTSDLHLGHDKIIEYCGRPFSDRDDMRRELIRRWNATVRPEDTVYVLGDFALYLRKREVEEILAELNGAKELAAGNHDHRATRNAKGWKRVFGATHTPFAYLIHDPFQLTVAYPGATGLVLHGHLHGNKGNRGHAPASPGVTYLDIGVDVDAMDYRPISEPEILRLLNNWRN